MRAIARAGGMLALTISTESFSLPVIAVISSPRGRRTPGSGALQSGYPDGCECCNSTSPSDEQALVKLQSISIHRSRRNFIQSTSFAAMASVLASPAIAATGADSLRGASSLPGADEKNIVALSGPLAPFSTTRTYRNIVLSNGLKVLLVKDTMAQRSSVALSIDGAGQFAEPPEIPGLAHLMEHIVLSSTRTRSGKPKVLDRRARRLWNPAGAKQADTSNLDGQEDFEEWLSDNEGDSNAFTAPGYVCFHFNGPHEILPEGLERFARLFTLDEIETTITQKPFVVPREIQRVADELDRTSDASRAFYFLKKNINPEHPFARFSAGSKTTLQTIPAENGIDVPTNLLQFFRDHYLSSKATLVVVGKDDLSALDRWISPFSNVMAQKAGTPETTSNEPTFPDPMLGKDAAQSNRLAQTVILRSKDDVQLDENIQTLCMEWPLSLVYGTANTGQRQMITTAALGFVLTQIISRRGPGSLRFFLEKFGWAPRGTSRGVPRISFPVDVSGFQILRMEIGLTLDGFANRSAVISAVFESLRKDIERSLKPELIKQSLAAGLLHGYLFAPRPPDSITMAVDALRFGLGGLNGIGNANGNWYLMPEAEDEVGVESMRQVVSDTLRTMADDTIPLVSFRASPKAIFSSSGGTVDQEISIPPVFSPWRVEPITGARYYAESRANGASSYFRSLAWFAANFDGEEMSPPYLNPLIPSKFRAPRPVIERQAAWGTRSFYLDDYEASAFDGPMRLASGRLKLTDVGTWQESPAVGRSEGEGSWRVWNIPPSKQKLIGLPVPVRPPEPSIEGAFVVQLLSSIPNTFTTGQLTLANLWLLSFDDEILDLAELGATAGIAYETSMNTAGLRMSFRGPSQTLPSYIRRFCRRLVRHHERLLDGSAKISESVYQQAISDANRSPKISRLQKQQAVETASNVSDREVAQQGYFFLRCVTGGCLISQGDVVPSESLKLSSDLQKIVQDQSFGSAGGFECDPDLRDLLYRPFWKPRDASLCLLPGLNLISDACGRVPR